MPLLFTQNKIPLKGERKKRRKKKEAQQNPRGIRNTKVLPENNYTTT
jgi:hypothetical protein